MQNNVTQIRRSIHDTAQQLAENHGVPLSTTIVVLRETVNRYLEHHPERIQHLAACFEDIQRAQYESLEMVLAGIFAWTHFFEDVAVALARDHIDFWFRGRASNEHVQSLQQAMGHLIPQVRSQDAA